MSAKCLAQYSTIEWTFSGSGQQKLWTLPHCLQVLHKISFNYDLMNFLISCYVCLQFHKFKSYDAVEEYLGFFKISIEIKLSGRELETSKFSYDFFGYVKIFSLELSKDLFSDVVTETCKEYFHLSSLNIVSFT